MRKAIGFAIMSIIMIQAVHLIPNVSPDNNKIEWTEHINLEGSCSMDNVRTHFQVNRTVVEIIVNLSWITKEGYADLNMWIEDTDGNFANASSSTQMPEIMRVREFPNRGRWTLVVVPYACGSSGEANYTANITLRNIVLPELEVSAVEIETGNNVSMSINSTYENVSRYYFDFGDGTDSGWINNSSISKTYDSPGEYNPKAKVRYSDGTESDWVEGGLIEVTAEEEKPCLILWVVIWTGILTLAIFLISILYDKRK